MALVDLCKFLAPRRPQNVRQILDAFYLQDGGVTKVELMRQTGLKLRTLEYYITKLRLWRIISTERHRGGPPHYHLEPRSFHARIDTILFDALRNLAMPKLLQSGSLRGPVKAERAEAAA